MNPTTITADPGLPFIEIERELDAPRDLVYRAYCEPELLAQWLGPRKYEMVVERWDVRDGGSWRYTHSDGESAYGFHGVFHGSASLEGGITQTFEFEGAPGHVALEHVDFVERDGRTLVRNHSVYQSVEARDAMVQSGMAEGITDGFARLDELLARLTPAGAAR